MLLVLRGPSAQLARKVPLACKDLRATLEPLVQWGQLAQLDPKALPAHKDLKVTLVRPALLDLLELRVPLALRVQLGQPGRKALRELLARREGLLADRSFRTAALSSCRLELPG